LGAVVLWIPQRLSIDQAALSGSLLRRISSVCFGIVSRSKVLSELETELNAVKIREGGL
jgi:hypothetical protein